MGKEGIETAEPEKGNMLGKDARLMALDVSPDDRYSLIHSSWFCYFIPEEERGLWERAL